MEIFAITVQQIGNQGPVLDRTPREAVRDAENQLVWLRQRSDEIRQRPVREDPNTPNSVFIFGLSRSGKTTLENILGSQPVVKMGYETKAVHLATKFAFQSDGFYDLGNIDFLPIHLFDTACEEYSRIICELCEDKNLFSATFPGSIWHIPTIYEIIPNCKFIFIKRNKRDLLYKIFYNRYAKGHHYSYDLKSLNNYIDIYYEFIDELRNIFPNNSLLIEYEDMVSEPAATLSRVCEFCGISPDYSLMPEIGSDIGCSEPYAEMIEAALSASTLKKAV